MKFKNQKEKEQERNSNLCCPLSKDTAPTITLENVVLDDKTREKINELLLISKRKERLQNYWKILITGLNVINLKGPPGCGKTITAYAIANSLNKPLMEIDVSSIMSKFYGETPKNLKQLFQKAKETNSIIILNEADSLFRKRDTEDTSVLANSENTNKNMLFNLLDTHEGLVILTTNLSKEYDKAFKSRMESIEFNLPDYEARLKLWQLYLKDIPVEDSIDYALIGYESTNFSGRDVVKCIRNAVLWSELNGLELLSTKTLKNVISEYKKSLQNEDVDYLNSTYQAKSNTVILK